MPEARLHILHVNDLPPGGPGGTEVALGRVVSAQRAAGHEVTVHFPSPPRRGAAKVFDLWDAGARRRLAALVERLGPDVVHFHNVVRELSPSVLGASSAPAVMTVHDLRWIGWSEHGDRDLRAVPAKWVLAPLTRALVKRHMQCTVAVSEVVAHQLRRHGLPTVAVVRPPVPAPAVPPTPPEECGDVVFVGRLAPNKGVDVLIDAFAVLSARHPEARLVVAGDGPQAARLRARAAGCAGVVFTGRLDQRGVSAVLGRARVAVMPSVGQEGLGLAAAEAACHGRPVVTSDVAGVREVCRLVGGQAVPAGDVAALAGALERWLSEPAAAAEAGRRARRAALAAFDGQTIRNQLDDVYRRAMARSTSLSGRPGPGS